MEEWIAENEETGGPHGLLDTMGFLVQETRRIGAMAENLNQVLMNLKTLNQEFLVNQELTDEWNEFLEEKENAVQKQNPEEIPTQEEAKDGKEVGKENTKGQKPSKKSKATKK